MKYLSKRMWDTEEAIDSSNRTQALRKMTGIKAANANTLSYLLSRFSRFSLEVGCTLSVEQCCGFGDGARDGKAPASSPGLINLGAPPQPPGPPVSAGG